MSEALEDFNTKRALEAYDILYNARDYDLASRNWSEQRSPRPNQARWSQRARKLQPACVR